MGRIYLKGKEMETPDTLYTWVDIGWADSGWSEQTEVGGGVSEIQLSFVGWIFVCLYLAWGCAGVEESLRLFDSWLSFID